MTAATNLIGVVPTDRWRSVPSHLSLGPHLAYDVSADLEASEHDDVGRFPVTSDIPTSCSSGPILCPY